ncbi:MAG: GNAT family N-acetyltransferase [Erysipelotrichales bacterium]|nr:MAG: GNAT family N-acetyltransferase [Erysipelotrichales bacterium]
MLRLAHEEDKIPLLKILRTDPARAMFIIGDIEQNGLHTEYQTTWIEEVDGVILAVYLKYHMNFVFYIISEHFDRENILLLLAATQCENVNAVKSHFVKVEDQIGSFVKTREMFFCACTALVDRPGILTVRKARPEDASRIARSLVTIVEFNLETVTIEEREERIRSRLSEGKSRAYLLEIGQEVVAYASTAVETKSSAMVASVFCLPAFRGRGYAKQVVWALSDDLLNSGLIPCLFYDNPNAGRIYHALGYQTFDTWVLGKNERSQP